MDKLEIQKFRPGLYDQLLDEHQLVQLRDLTGERLRAEIRKIDPAELPDRICELMGSWVSNALNSIHLNPTALKNQFVQGDLVNEGDFIANVLTSVKAHTSIRSTSITAPSMIVDK